MRNLQYLLNGIVLVLLVGLVQPVQAQEQVIYPTSSGWQTSSPEAQGMDSAVLETFLTQLTDSASAYHSLVLIRHGVVVLDVSLPPFSSSKPQAFRSSAEPIMAALIGIAIDQGLIRSIDQSIWDFLPKDKTINMDADKAALTIQDVLTHHSGLSFIAGRDIEKYYPLGIADQPWVQFFLDAPMAATRGSDYLRLYGDGLVLSAILQQASGMTALEFARQNLFEPLGIENVFWGADPQGITIGQDEIYLSAQDMARIAYLYLHNGRWEGRQILSEIWAQAATSIVAAFPPGADFKGIGYGWNHCKYTVTRMVCQGTSTGDYFGFFPDVDLVYAITGDVNENSNPQWEVALAAISGAAALPENPDAFARLQAKITELETPEPRAVPVLPDTFTSASGKLFTLADNPLGWQTLAIEFGVPDANAATLMLGIDGRVVPIATGLDFVDRITPVGLPAQPASAAFRLRGDLPWIAKANWADSHLNIWMGDLTGRETWLLMLDFTDDSRVKVGVNLQGVHPAVCNPGNWKIIGQAQ